jgi:hypothetical protein
MPTIIPFIERIGHREFDLGISRNYSDPGNRSDLSGAGVFGLAISFGSQSLVRDIISGLFYMWDDAFRVGEYIDSGRLKRTVEALGLRSVKLQGIADIADKAVVVRLKFTARPIKPSWVQREYLKRLHLMFHEKGVTFASGSLTLQVPPAPERAPATDASVVELPTRTHGA